jgi:HEAT repeat protein
MSQTILLLALLAPAADATGPPNTVRLQELLYDRQQPRLQSQAALLLVQDHSADAEDIVRRGLKQTDSPEVFTALTSALRLSRDVRFRDELLTALMCGQPTYRQNAAAVLAEMMDGNVLQRLEFLLEDRKADIAVRQAALWTLGRCGRKQAAGILLEQLSHDQDAIRRVAAEALAELTGRNYGNDVVRWREWWDEHKDMSNERWLEERMDFQGSRLRRLESELERSKSQIVRLQEQLYARLPLADRLGHVLGLVDHEDASIRSLAIRWSTELLPATDMVGQCALTDLLLRFSHDGTPEVQRAAVLALGKVHDSRAFDRLLLLLENGPPSVRAASARSLAQQARGNTPDAKARQRIIVPVLRNALKDTALEVVVEAAEDLGSLGVPEAGPVLTDLLRHPSAPVRQAASLALERMADLSLLDGLLQALDDPVITVRFRLVGAIGHAVGEGRGLSEEQRTHVLERLERVLMRDADPGVRSRAASVLGACGTPDLLQVLWRRLAPTEDSRVQEKAWTAFLDILARAGDANLVLEWEQTLARENQQPRRLQLLTEICTRWQKREETRLALTAVQELLVPAQLDQGKWAAAFPHVRDLLTRPASDPEMQRRLRWLLRVGQQALKESNRSEALRVVQLAQTHRDRLGPVAAAFERLEREARQEK